MKQYNLSFTKEDDRWYIDLPDWKFAHSDLEMVEGADKLCEELSKNDHVKVQIFVTNDDFEIPNEHDIKLVRQKLDLFCGADYNVYGSNLTKTCWICPVTLFVFQEYPKYIYIKNN